MWGSGFFYNFLPKNLDSRLFWDLLPPESSRPIHRVRHKVLLASPRCCSVVLFNPASQRSRNLSVSEGDSQCQKMERVSKVVVHLIS